MRLGALTLILIATLVGSAFWYAEVDATCRVPVRYYIGTVDDRFGTTKEEMLRIVQNAEKMWEEKLKTELFIYDENGDLPINLVFDERQENADIEAELREDLEVKEGMSESVASQYESLIKEFRSLKKSYESRVINYETDLKKYNSEVSEWNEKGGAPESVIESLRDREEQLQAEQRKLEAEAKELNRVVSDLNRIGARGNTLITDYNEIVEKYNERFSEVKEFAQGDYTGDAINVYQFDSEEDLTIVLAHELGHALSLDHVTEARAIMYHHMEEQSIGRGVTVEDQQEYERVCGNKGALRSILEFLR